MPDIEKLKKALSLCMSSKTRCSICPYVKEHNCNLSMVSDAIALMKKQKVKLVRRIVKSEDNGTYFTMIWYECEECGHKVNGDDSFCGGCGKEIDRSEVKDDG